MHHLSFNPLPFIFKLGVWAYKKLVLIRGGEKLGMIVAPNLKEIAEFGTPKMGDYERAQRKLNSIDRNKLLLLLFMALTTSMVLKNFSPGNQGWQSRPPANTIITINTTAAVGISQPFSLSDGEFSLPVGRLMITQDGAAPTILAGRAAMFAFTVQSSRFVNVHVIAQNWHRAGGMQEPIKFTLNNYTFAEDYVRFNLVNDGGTANGGGTATSHAVIMLRMENGHLVAEGDRLGATDIHEHERLLPISSKAIVYSKERDRTGRVGTRFSVSGGGRQGLLQETRPQSLGGIKGAETEDMKLVERNSLEDDIKRQKYLKK